MKRSILFWPLVVGAGVFLLWVVFCFFVVGLPLPGNTSGTYRSPAYRVLSRWQSSVLAQSLMSLTNRLWRVVPYCRAPKSDPTWEGLQAPVGVEVHFVQQGRSYVCVGPQPQVDASKYAFDIPYWILSPGEVLGYVVLVPGVHFGGVAFVLALVVSAATKLLFKAIGLPQGASGEHGKE